MVFIRNTLLLVSLLWSLSAAAVLKIEITGGSEGALPIAVVPFGVEGPVPIEDVSAIIKNDLLSSGRFYPLQEKDLISQPNEGRQVNFADWRLLRSEGLLIGKINSVDGENYQVQFELFDVYREKQLLGKRFNVPARGLRHLSHQIADMVYEALTGEKGVFSTRVAFVSETKNEQGKKRYILQLADVDGNNPRTVLQSNQPILSPAWSPDNQRLAYVSFEKGKSEIYVQELRTGQRQSVAAFRGLNSAPAWSPDSKKLALTLSKNGNPEIYTLELATGNLKRLTNNSQSIDTEPVWMPNGSEILFTSDRGGRPQIYRIDANGGRAERVTFEGSYNTSADISPDGSMMTMVHAENGQFHIAVQDLSSGAMQVLTETQADESPSFAPNGRAILYATHQQGRGVLATVSVDGRVKQRLGDVGKSVREPAWSPFKQ